MRTTACILALACLSAAEAAAVPSAQESSARRVIAVLEKGPPPGIPPPEWRFFRLVALVELGENSAAAAVAVPYLLRVITDQDAEVAAGALLRLDPASAHRSAAVAALRRGLGESTEARRAATDALDRLPAITPDLEQLLVDDLRTSRPGRARTAELLQRITPDRVAGVVPVLAGALAGADPELKIAAASTLESFETLAGAAAPALRRLLREANPRVVLAAASALVYVDAAPDPALAAIFIPFLESSDSIELARALDGLDIIGPGATAAIPALKRLQQHASEEVTERATIVLSAIDPATPNPRAPIWSRVIPEWDVPTALRQFQSADHELRQKGLEAIQAHREAAAAAVPALVAALGDADLPFRYRVAYTLTTVDPVRAVVALPVLKDMMRSDVTIPGSSPRILASIGLGRLGSAGAEALLEALRAPEPETRQAAAVALMTSDEFHASAIPALLTAARDADESVRLQSLATLISRDADAAVLMPALIAALDDASAEIRALAASALTPYRAAARMVLPRLRAMARDADPNIAMSARLSLAAIDPDGATHLLPFFIAALSSRSPGTFAIGRPGDDLGGPGRRLQAIFGIQALGTRASAALPALRQVWNRDARVYQLAAGAAIIDIDPKAAPDIIAALIQLLERPDADGQTHYGVLAFLSDLGPRAAAAESAIRGLLTSEDPDLRKLAAKALEAIRAR